MKKFLVFLIIMLNLNLIYAQKEKIDFRPSSFDYTSFGLRDPFEDYTAPRKKTKAKVKTEEEEKPKPLPVFTIQGVVWEGAVPVAIINNKVVKVGEELEGAKIIAIDKEGVSFLYYGREYKVLSPAYIYKKRGEKK